MAQEDKTEKDTAAGLQQQALSAARAGEFEKAVKLASEAIAADPKSTAPYVLRGRLYSMQGKSQQAADDFGRAIKLEPNSAGLYDLRGSEQFTLGRIKESIADFDKAIELDESRERGHWKRGISYYYAGEYDKGRRQFEAYQTYDDNDVENAVWRYLCMARDQGVNKARGDILRIKRDPRVPMMQVYDLYAGRAKPEDVMTAVKKDDPSESALNQRLFYAHLYLGLYYDAAGDDKQALEHIEQAEKHRIGHYMWDVAKVHGDLLRKKAQ